MLVLSPEKALELARINLPQDLPENVRDYWVKVDASCRVLSMSPWFSKIPLQIRQNIFDLIMQAWNWEAVVSVNFEHQMKSYIKKNFKVPIQTTESINPLNIDSESFSNPSNKWQNQILADEMFCDILAWSNMLQYYRYIKNRTSAGKNFHQKQLGAFYTPIPVICCIVEKVIGEFLSNPPSISTGSHWIIMDPTCGMGLFLFITAAFWVLRQEKIKNEQKSSKRVGLIHPILLLGVDSDPMTIIFAQIMQILLNYHPRFGIQCQMIRFFKGDSLHSWTQIIQSNTQSISISNPSYNPGDISTNPLLYKEPFVHAIVTNPPYISWGLGRVGKLTSQQASEYRQSFPLTSEYKISIFALFIERGLQLLLPGGWAGFLIPDSFLTGKYFRKLRQFLLDHTDLRNIMLFNRSFWRNADSGKPVILILNKPLPIKEDSLRKIQIQNVELHKNQIETQNYNTISPEYFRQLERQRFRLIFDAETYNMITQMESNAVPLKIWFEGHHGIRSRSGIGKNRIIGFKPLNEQWRPGIVAGAEVKPYIVEQKGYFIHIQPQLLYSGGYNPNHIEREKILLRRTGDRLIAAVDTDKLYHTNSLIYLIPRSGVNSPISLFTLCGILNSDIMNQYYQAITMKHKRSMAQVEVDTLEHLPLKIQTEILTEIEIFVRRIHQIITKKDIYMSDLDRKEEYQNLIKQINYAAKKLYLDKSIS